MREFFGLKKHRHHLRKPKPPIDPLPTPTLRKGPVVIDYSIYNTDIGNHLSNTFGGPPRDYRGQSAQWAVTLRPLLHQVPMSEFPTRGVGDVGREGPNSPDLFTALFTCMRQVPMPNLQSQETVDQIHRTAGGLGIPSQGQLLQSAALQLRRLDVIAWLNRRYTIRAIGSAYAGHTTWSYKLHARSGSRSSSRESRGPRPSFEA